jgi:hypothetical protein
VDWKYKKFKYRYATSPKAAFEKECQNYHDIAEGTNIDTKNHPQRPDSIDWKCPGCDKFN